MKTQHETSGLILAALLAAAAPCQKGNPTPGDAGPGGNGQQVPPTPVYQQMVTGAPNDWFTHTKLYIGEFLNKETVIGKFQFENPTGKAMRWMNLQGSCQCVRAVITLPGRTYELSKKPVANSLHELVVKDGKTTKKRVTHLNIKPGDKGDIHVHMEMGGLQGYKEATLAITTTDSNMKQVTLSWQAKGVKLFDVVPNDVFINDMKWGESRKFSFVVQSNVKPNFKLLDHEPLPDYVKLTKKQIKQPNGKPAWKVEGTFGPRADPKAGGAAIKFKTDWDGKEVTFNVIATITGPVTVHPGSFLSFGKIRKGKGAERQIVFSPNGKYDLKLEKVEFPKLTIDRKYISAVSEKQGEALVVTIKIAPEVQGAYLVRGSIVLQLNHPAYQAKKFNFNGILR